MKIVPVFHGKTGGGYLTQFYPPVNTPITFLGITQDKDGHFKFVVAEGVNEEGPIFMFVRPAPPIIWPQPPDGISIPS